MPRDLRVRNLQSELMDDPSLDQSAHQQALTGLRRINWWSRTDTVIWRAIRRNVRERTDKTPITILDIASGGGDLAIRLARIAQRESVPVQIHGCDISATAITHSSAQAAAAGLKNVTFHQCNALEEPLPQSKYDFVMCSLFLHHLNDEQGTVLLKRMQAAASRLVLIDDLRRTRFGYWLAWLGCRLLTRCYVVHMDGPMSVEGAYSTDEASVLAAQAGLKDALIEHHWPQRFLLSWIPAGATHADR